MADGKGKVFTISLALPSATVGKFAKWPISQEAQVGATCPLCRLPPMAKVSLPSAADGKEPALPLFILFFLYPTIITGNISQQIYHRSQHIYIQHNKYPAHIYPYIHSRLHIVPSIHTYYNMQSFIIASEQNTRSASKEKTGKSKQSIIGSWLP